MSAVQRSYRRGSVVILPDAAEAARAVAERLVHLARAALDAQGIFRIALSGGATPGALYRLLASDEFRGEIDWTRCDIWWGDERWVPADHPDSSYRLADETLLSKVPVQQPRIHRVLTEVGDPALVARLYEAELRIEVTEHVNGVPRLDLILLGIGPDGHTASLFPESPALLPSDRLVADVVAPKPPPHRVTFTPNMLNAARERIFLVTGAEKAEALFNVLHGPYQPDVWPAQVVEAGSSMPLWVVDEAAAARLPD